MLAKLLGMGGIGKTSLALAAGRQLIAGGEQMVNDEQHPFPNGVWFVALEGIEDNTLENIKEEVAALIGLAMGLYFHSEGDLWMQLLGQLAEKKLLLILDNIEQFLKVASDLIVELLAAGNGIHLLVTSRTTLPLAASVAFPLSGLKIPTQTSMEVLQNESVRLFAERASRLPSSFDLEKHLAEVVAICQFLDGMPLGIELAAASVGRLLIGEVMPALKSNLKLVNSSRSDLPPRQRALQAVFDYTWKLLDRREQTILVQISVFRDGFTRQAAEAVVYDAGSGLYNLHLHALLNRDDIGRFKMHPLLRQLAGERLSGSEKAETSNRHSVYFSKFIGAFETELRAGIGREAIQAILLEQANLRAAWEYAVQTGQWQLIANCMDSAHYFFQRKGFYSLEGLLVDNAVNTLQPVVEAGNVPLTSLLSRLLTLQAMGRFNSAKFEEGMKIAEQACELAQSVKDAGIEAQARIAIAKLLFRDHSKVLDQYEQAVILAKLAEDPFLEADCLSEIGKHLSWQAMNELARESLELALSLCQSLPYKSGELDTLIRLAGVAGSQENHAESIAYYEQSLQLSRLMGDVVKEALVLGNTAVSFAVLGDLVGRQRYQKEALAIRRRLNLPNDICMTVGELGYTSIELGDYDSAENQLTESLEIATYIKDEFWQAWVKLRLGKLWHERGDLEKSLSLLDEALQTGEKLQSVPLQARVLYDWGNVLISQEDWKGAEQKFQKAYDLWHARGKSENALLALAGLAYVTYQQEAKKTAVSHADHLWQTLQESPSWAERANLKMYWMLGMVWQGLKDSRFETVREKAQTLLRVRSEKISDDAARQMFLQNNSTYRAISNGW